MAIMPIIPDGIVNIKYIGIYNVETNARTHDVIAAQFLLANNATIENTAPRTIKIMCGVTKAVANTPPTASASLFELATPP